MKRHVPALALAIAALCHTPAALAGDTAAATASARADNAFLSQPDAAARAARLANIDYVLDFTLTGKASFSATSTVQFDLLDASAPLTLDLDKATIATLTVNGKVVQPQYNNWFITLAPADLVKGRNTVTVVFTRLHSTNGEGLHRMTDPVDGRVYTYSHFEPAAAHQMFAVFDQPDLKATYQLSVTAPADWTVISSTRESGVQPAGDAARRWTFPRTKKLSAYNFSMHAGPYKMWEDTSGPYPMRLFARQSVASQIKPEEWFKYTKQGLAFFDNYFGVPYQFAKYDQILVPDFLYGAMENAGAITFSEAAFLYKADMTAAQRQYLAGVILHEMAHQWFGDLVTMKWWNGLWLNESFASFMGTLATAESTEFKDAWQNFYSNEKQGAYLQDQGPGTHPIEVPVPSTANAFDNIDSITYAKGASTLAQLRHLLGEVAFRKGVHNYLTKYSYQNATLDDFIGELGKAAGRDLTPWTREWLYQAGVDTVAADYTCKAGRIASFSLKQTAPSAALPTLREQRVQVATFKLEAGKLVLSKNVAVTYSGAATAVPELAGSACPDLVYPNYQDWGYVKVALDPRSLATARDHLASVDQPLLRTMLWQSLWDGVRDGTMPLNAFLDTALANAPREQDYTLLGDVLRKVLAADNLLDRMGADTPYARRTRLALEQMAWQGVIGHVGNGDFQRRWFRSWLDLSASTDARNKMAGLLDGTVKVDGLAIDQDLRWAIIAQLNRRNDPAGATLITAEAAQDNSAAGHAAAIVAEALRPDPAIKTRWLATIMNPKTPVSFSQVREAMYNLYPADQRTLNEASASSRLAQLAVLDQSAGPVYMRAYAGSMIPATCTPASVARLTQAVADMPKLSALARRSLKNTLAEDQRCVAIGRAMTAH